MADEIFEHISPPMLLSYLDSIHDFKRHLGMVDRPNTMRGEPPSMVHYWRNFAFNILRTGMGGEAFDSYLLNGCTRFGLYPEELGMELAKKVTRIGEPIKIDYEANTPGEFYTRLLDVLGPYRQHGLIPIVVDTEFCLHKDAEKLREMNSKFAICKNMEMYSDPSRTAKREFYSAEWREVPGATREYGDTSIKGPLNVIVSGSINSVTIQYSGRETYLTEHYKLADRVLPNSIGSCKDAFSTLLRTGDFHHTPIIYCKLQKENTFMEGQSWDDVPLLRLMAIHLMKKRHGDQLQVKSCLEEIAYERDGKQLVFGGKTPCVFWSYDRLAIAFAILLHIPCVHQMPNKNVMVYLPKRMEEGGAQGGGACTRANLEHTAAELSTTSEALMDEINRDTDCLKRYVELHLEIDKIQYSPIYLLYLLKLKKMTVANLGEISDDVFSERDFVYHVHHSHAQLYINEAEAINRKIGRILNNDATILFYAYKYRFFIMIDGGTIRVKTTLDGSTVGPKVKTIYEFTSSILTIDEHSEIEEAVAEGGGAMRGGSVSPKRNPFLNLLQRMKQVENYMVVFSDSRDRFMAEDKKNPIERGGYTSYEMVFFFRAAVELFERVEDKPQFCRAFRAVFDTLNTLGEKQLSNEINFFLNTFTKFHSKSVGSEEAKPIIAAVLAVAKAYSEEAQAAMESFGFNEHRMIDYLEKHLPLGSFGRYYSHLKSSLQTYTANPVGLSTIVKQPRRSHSRVTKRSLNTNLREEIPGSKRERRNLTKRRLSPSLEAEITGKRGTRRLSSR
jgi:hypothetical protein